MENIHDHCRVCHSKFCDFDIVEDVSCGMMFCRNDCGQKFHQCKQEDHKQICLHQNITCINKQYGCPAVFQQRYLAIHLEVCPANIQICTMEWNRWHRGSLLSRNDEKAKVSQMKSMEVVSKNLDVAAAIHDQKILLETIMPNEVLEYYNQRADQSYTETDSPVLTAVSELGITKETTKEQSDLLLNEESTAFESGERSEIVLMKTDADEHLLQGSSNTAEIGSCEESPGENTKHLAQNEISPASRTQNFLKYVGMIQNKNNHKDTNASLLNSQQNHPNSSNHRQNATPSNGSYLTEKDTSLPYNGLFSFSSYQQKSSAREVQKEKVIAKLGKVPYFEDIDAYIDEFVTAIPDFLLLLDSLDSDICVAIDVVDHIINEVVNGENNYNITANHELPVIDWNEENVKESEAGNTENKCYELRRSISELLQEFGVVCDLTIGSSSSSTAEERRALRRAERRKRRSWLYNNSAGTSSSSSTGTMTSWGWMPRKEVKDVSTDTNDLVVDQSNMEWLSPEAFTSKDDLMFRLFSIIGASYRGYASMHEKQLSPFITDSSSQTMAPFLLHIDMNAIGRALCSASLSSSVQNIEERRQMLLMLTRGKLDESGLENDANSSVKMNDNLIYNNLSLGSVMESVPRYQTKPHSMYSFMCGCLLRRDQFASHIQNTHCEIMSGLNGWIEQKCPYAAYGCNYTQPRFCPDHYNNAVVFSQSLNAFTVRPDLWSHTSTHTDENSEPEQSSDWIEFLNLPYELHEKLFNYLDCFSLNQLSLTCTYMREVCRNHLSTRGIVEVKWIKRTYEDGTQSWKMGEKIWSFPPAFTKINRWVLPDNLPMVEHVSKCPVIAACDLKYKEEKVRVFY